MMQRIEKHLPILWKLAFVAGGVQTHQWIAKNLGAQWHRIPRTALLSIADATVDTPPLHAKSTPTELKNSLVEAFKKAAIVFQVPAN